MGSINNGCRDLRDDEKNRPLQMCDTAYKSEGEPNGPLTPAALFKPEAECGPGDMYLAKNPDDPDGDPIPMMKIDKKWLDDFESTWFGPIPGIRKY